MNRIRMNWGFVFRFQTYAVINGTELMDILQAWETRTMKNNEK